MHRSSFSRAVVARTALGILFTLGLEAVASAQLGHVVKAQKISATTGGFDAVLEEMDQFGRSIVNLGDMDGNGVTDLLVGAHTDDDGAVDQGSVYILFLKSNGTVDHWQKISDLEGNFADRLRRGDQFGRAAANLGDLDGDGVIDLAVSANYDDDGGANKGAVYVLFMNTDGTVKQSQKISEEQGGLPVNLAMHDEFGRSLTALGDMDGDGLSELLVGTPEDDEGGTNTGALHVLFLNANGTVKKYKRISKFSSGLAIKPGDWFGFSTANLGDFDGDGVVDIAAGSVLDDDGGVNQGSLWILFLRADGSVKSARELDEIEGGFTALDDIDQFGTSVANIGDLDGDGVIDLTVGAVKDDDGGQAGDPDADVGAVYVLFMNPDASVKSWVKLSDLYGSVPFALDQWDWFGSALCRLGGSPGDGLFNVAIGCRNDDDAGGNLGAIYLTQLNDGTAPAAQFEASTTLGVPPLTVNFTDTSGGEVTAWNWNFGDGGQQSTLRNPTKTYTSPGTYDVQLVARGPKGLDSEIKRGFITVASGVLAAFDAGPRSGPCPLSVSFTDRSSAGVTSWSWDFGDGQGSTLEDPVHVYSACGTYTVALTITGPNGSDTRVETDFVVAALEPPMADFTATPASGPAPLDVQFGDATSGQATSWSWDFGDGQLSDLASPLHRYAGEGTYTVTLTATGPGGSDTETKTALITVTPPPPSAYFEASPTLGPEPLTVAFTNVTTGAVDSWAWDFGDGATSSERDPVHVYQAPGVYTVTLTADGPNGSDVRTLTNLITVEPGVPVAAFDAAPASGEAPLSVQFTDLSTLTVTSWTWSFGDGATSAERHPTHTYTVPGSYTVELNATGPGGSNTLTLVDRITVDAPPTLADFEASPVTGTTPLTVAFTDLSSPNVTSWTWDFGDGTGSSERDPAHVYTGAGTFDVALRVTSPTGDDLRTRAGLVTVIPPPPEAQFGADPTLGFAPLSVQFSDASIGPVTSWEWSFGDGASSTDANPAHVYTSPGTYGVTLTARGPGGEGGESKPAFVSVLALPPAAEFLATPMNGDAPLAVQFTDVTFGLVTSWSWSFGDGATSSDASPAHVYATPGTFTVTLAATGPGGTDLETKADLVTVAEPAPVAAFGATPESGTAPLAVQFTSACAGLVTSWAWDLGDGTTSSAASPSHVYTTSGTYTVTLTATGPGGTDVETKPGFVTVMEPPPVAGFGAAPTTGLAPLAVQFTNASSGLVSSWSWSFGDGATSTDASPSHVYTTPGEFTVTLTASGPGGSDVETKPAFVSVPHPAPVAAFSATPTSGSAPLAVQFTNATSGLATSWSWSFGDGTSSSAASPSLVYATAGTFTVTLTATGPGGTDLETKADLVTVAEPAPVAAFGATPESGTAPLAVQFTSACAGLVTSWAWDLGDGTTSSAASPSHVYTTSGTYTVTLTATGPGGTDVETKPGFVTVMEPPPVADFGAAPTNGLAPLAVQFTNASSGLVTSWAWSFGDGATSNEASPSHVYTSPGDFTVSLTATGPGGTDVETKQAFVSVPHPAPEAAFSAAPESGVAPLAVQFTNVSSGLVTSWAWSFGDGATSNSASPSHVYATSGTFTVTLTATGPGGTDLATKTDLVTVAEPAPVAAFGATPQSGTAPLAVQFTNASTGLVTSWAWDLGDGTTSSAASPSHVYTAPGTYTVTLATTGPGGTDVETKPAFVTVTEPAPVADFGAAPATGAAPLAVQFTNASSGLVTSWSWSFGDGATSNEASPLHVYTTPGDFAVTLTASGPGGSDVETKPAFVSVPHPAPEAAFSATPTSGTAPLSVQFTNASSGLVTSWSWAFGDGATSNSASPSHVYTTAGTFSVTLTATGPGGIDVESKLGWVAVAEPAPVANFGATPTSGSAPLTVQFTNATSGLVTSWAWDLGDGTTSSAASPSTVYTTPGAYTVTLTASGPGGTDAETKSAFVVVVPPAPAAAFSAAPTSGTAPLAVQFTDGTSGAVTAWSWSFGDGATASAASPAHVYTTPGTFAVTLTATGPGGTDAETKAGLITVVSPAPVADFTATPTSGTAPLSVRFTDTTTGVVTSRSWSFGDGAISNAASPTHDYTTPGTFTVTLTATGPGGTDAETKSALITVTEPAPVAAFSATPTSGTAPLSVQFTNASTGVATSWAWTFGDGSTSTEASPAHVFTTPGTFAVTLTATGPGGTDLESKPAFVTVAQPAPVAAFSAAPASGTAPLSVQFTNTTTGVVTSWAWNFGDGTSSSAASPTKVYTTPGTYPVRLVATGPGGTDAEVKPAFITVSHPAPVADFQATPTSGTAPLAVQFTNTTSGVVTSWAWSFGDGATSSAASPAHVYTTAGTFTVTLTATGPGGTDAESKSALVTVVLPAPVAAFAAAPTTGAAPLAVQFTDATTGPVASFAWDFGDGSTSSAASPAHLYATAGIFTVTLVATGPGGTDGETKTALVRVSTVPPVAEFTVTPREGFAPLQSAFTDQSTGQITSRSWSFGDGGSSTLTDPLHVFLEPDSYVVTLQVSGPGGQSLRRRTVLVRAAPPFADGSFEGQAPGLAPSVPWSVYSGGSVLVRPTTVASDQGFPSQGDRWCDIGAQGSSAARPPSNPNGPGIGATGTAGLTQDFLFPSATPHLLFEAAFLLNGSQESVTRNDFMSVDVSDGTTVWNVFYADSYSELPLVSTQHGFAMTARETVRVDLRALFPGASESTVLSLRAAVGNVGGGVAPSRGYLDGLRLLPSATATFRNGHDRNPVFYVSSPSVLGGDWRFDIDAAALPGARTVVLEGRRSALAGIPAAGGELLISGPSLFKLSFAVSPGINHFVQPMPDDPALLGITAYTQASLAGRKVVRGNAYDLFLGY